MLVILKKPLQPGLNHLSLPLGSQVLHAATQDPDCMFLWYLRPKFAPTLENHTFLWVGSGHDIEEAPAGSMWRHITTSFDSGLVWHVFELVSAGDHVALPGVGEQLVEEEGR